MLLSVAVIVILVVAAGGLFMGNSINGHNADENSKTKDSDGDGLSDYDEVHVTHTDPHTADTDGGGVNDFHEVFTYSNMDSNNPKDDHELIAKLPHVEAKLWNPHKIGIKSEEDYVKLSLTDPVLNDLAKHIQIKWADNTKKIGSLLVDGSPIATGHPSNTEFVSQPSYFFTHDRNGDCVESTLAELAILRLNGFRSIIVPMSKPDVRHMAPEALIDGNVYVVNFGSIFSRDVYYKNTGFVPDPGYDSEWYLK